MAGKRSRAPSRTRAPSKKFRKGFDRTVGYYGRFGPKPVFRGRRATTEYKFFDTDGGNAAINQTGTVTSLNLIEQGAGENQRIGRKCVIKSIHIRGAFSMQSTTSTTMGHQRVRCMVVLDTQANGQTTSRASIIDGNTGGSAIDHWRNLSESNRYKVLMDKTWALNYTAATSTDFQEHIKTWKMNKKCNIPLEFGFPTAGITGIRSNNIILLQFVDSTAPVVNSQWVARVRFSDS